MSHTLRAAVAGTCLVGLSLTAPGVARAVQHTIGDKDYGLRVITIPSGRATGWHYHDGTLYAYVKQGTLTRFDATCAPDGVYGKGSFLEEPPGAEHVHLGENRGTTAVVLEVLYVLPHGAPLSRDAVVPGCTPR
ncbi:cupin domain-containing protein [Streptomyces sp. NPDC057412]|uniref:cupin domain-containing protein n=1 Tax=Streptomyces sp. NPDC057412 TaxID=3346123 RepID=UPI0036B8A9BB